jgi:fructose-1,6-bisphosphatase I
MPRRGHCYAINETYIDVCPPLCRTFVNELKNGRQAVNYRMRFIGSLVAEFHRTLLQGGIFLYPPTASHPQGLLRLVYEANPIAFPPGQVGGASTNGQDRILNLHLTDLHERVPLYFGSSFEMDALRITIKAAAGGPGHCDFDVST